jgi:hypothetical protein
VFQTIADDLYKQTQDITFNMVAPAYPVGTKLRMTFDVPLGNNSPSAAAASRNYLEGEIAYTNGHYELVGVTYNGDIRSASGSTVGGVLERLVTYTFAGFQGFNLKDSGASKMIQQWSMAEGSSIWQVNSEYIIDPRTATTVVTKSTVIYLVLDSSNSLDDSGVQDIRLAVKEFLNIMYTGEAPVLPTPSSSVAQTTPAPAPVVGTPDTPASKPPIIRPDEYLYIHPGRRVGAMVLNPIFGIGSSFVLGDWGGGVGIGLLEGLGFLMALPLFVSEMPDKENYYRGYGNEYDDEAYNEALEGYDLGITIGVIGAVVFGTGFIVGLILPWTYHPKAPATASANPFNGFDISFGANRQGNLDKVSLTYTYSFRH